jgi:serine/threonine-protein kinase
MNVVLRVTGGPYEGREYVFERHDTFVVGRSSQVDFPVPDDRFLSRDHFLIEFNPPVCFLKDMGSTNGTKVNGLRVDATRLHDGDVIEAGRSSFVVQVTSTAEALPRIRCRVCGREATDDVAVAFHPGDRTLDWYCEGCRDQRRRYPSPPQGYWIEARIGGGGMGEVYRGRELASRRPVAIKMMIPTSAAGEDARLRFRREMLVMRDLRHTNIVEFYDVYEDEGQFQLIMEYVDGANARDWVARLPGPLSVPSASWVGVQLLAALEHAHGKGYVHRDIKPSNLLVAGPHHNPLVKLSDFGLAKNFRDDAGFAGLTHQGDIGGSVGFLSPDHIRGFHEVKEPADLYSAGATLYYLLTGRYPYLDFDPNRADAYAMIMEHPPVPLRVHRPDAPEALERVLHRALEKQPYDRWQSAEAMAAALQPFLEGP